MTISYKPSIALIGAGDWGKNIARTLHKMGVLSAVVDPSEKAHEIAHDLKVPIFTMEQALKEPHIEGVVIATPTPTHFPLAEAALSHGKNVLVEKPMARSCEEIATLSALAHKKGLTLMVGHLLLYHKAFQKLGALVQSQKLGTLLSIETSRKNLGKIHPHEGVLWDLGPHDFSMVLSLLGRLPKALLSHSLDYVYGGKQDVQDVLMEYEDGPSVRVSLSRLHPIKEQKVIVVGTKGAAVFDDTREWQSKLTFYPYDVPHGSFHISRGEMELVDVEASEPLREELTHFLKCCKNGTTPLSSPREAQHVLSLIQAAEESARKKDWVRF